MSWTPAGERWKGQGFCLHCNAETHGQSEYCSNECAVRFDFWVVNVPGRDDLGPRYRHNCDRCKWLGRFDAFDLWFCGQPDHPTLSSILRRNSSKGSDYLSTHPPSAFAGSALSHVQLETKFGGRWYAIALCRIAELKLLTPDVIDPGT
jgi:hypothetical protein